MKDYAMFLLPAGCITQASQTGFKWVQNVCWHEEGKSSSSLFPCLRWLINNGLEVDRREVIFRLSKQSNFSPRNLLCGSCLSYRELVHCITSKEIVKQLLLCLLSTYLIWDLRYQETTIKAVYILFFVGPVTGNPITFLGQFF